MDLRLLSSMCVRHNIVWIIMMILYICVCYLYACLMENRGKRGKEVCGNWEKYSSDNFPLIIHASCKTNFMASFLQELLEMPLGAGAPIGFTGSYLFFRWGPIHSLHSVGPPVIWLTINNPTVSIPNKVRSANKVDVDCRYLGWSSVVENHLFRRFQKSLIFSWSWSLTEV